MANPLFGIVAAARLDITVGSSSRAAYFALVAQYQFGPPIIHARAPQELATAIAVPFYSGIADPGINNSVPGVVVVSFPNPTPSVVVNGVAFPVSTNVPGGTLVGVNYVDSNGILWPNVDWEWQISVEAYNQTGNVGSWDQQVIQYTGTGVNGAHINTTFPLDTVGARVAIWVFSQGADIAVFRHNAMPGSTYAVQPISTLGGIMTFDSTGFTIADNAGQNIFTNRVGIHYTALVMRDTTSDFRYMRLGDYPTWKATSVINQIAAGSHTAFGQSSPPSNNDTGITVENLGQTLFAGGLGNIVPTNIISTKSYAFSGPAPGSLGNFGIDAVVVTRVIQTGGILPVSQVWLFNRPQRQPFGSLEFVTPNSVSFGPPSGASDTIVTSLGAGVFGIGLDDSANGSNQGHYYFVAFSIPVGDPVRNLFTTYSVIGSGGVVGVVLGFSPAFVAGRPITPGSPSSVWRGPWHTGTQSTRFDQTALGTDGIVAMTANGFQMGPTSAPAGITTYGWAMAGSGSVAVNTFALVPGGSAPSGGPVIPSAGVVPGGTGPDGGGGGGGQVCKISTTLTTVV